MKHRRAPKVAFELESAQTELAGLEAQGAELTLALVEGKAGAAERLAEHRSRIDVARRAIAELTPAMRLAEQHDAKAAAEEQHRQRLRELAELEGACTAKEGAVFRFCEAIRHAAAAYIEINEHSAQIVNWLPTDTRLPPGLLANVGEVLVNGIAQPAGHETLAASEMWRSANITRIGQGGALPGARAIIPGVLFNGAAVESWADSAPRLNNFILGHVKRQIDAFLAADLEKIASREEVNLG